jgi:4'-phosphopantetheinyl transferase EntD
MPLPEDLTRTVCTPLDRLPRASPLATRMVFCAKEATYKAQYAQSGHLLEFHDLAVTLFSDTGRFTSRLTRPCPPFEENMAFHGRVVIADGIIVALVTLPGAVNTVFPYRGQ